jgi:exonuclease VII small subunit
VFKQKKTGELIVKPRYSSRVKLFIAGLVVVVLLVTGGVIYNHGLSMAGFESLTALRRQQNLQQVVDQLEQDNLTLRDSLARAERSLQMDHSAYQELDRSLKVSSQEIVRLREELNFYRNIISPPNKKSGLRIQSLKLEAADADDTTATSKYHYKMVLIQALKHDRKITGKARFEITGVQGGANTTIRFPQTADKSINFSFKYFQDIEGQIELPQNFEPQTIKVNVTSRGRNAESIEQVYPWPKA